MLDFPADTQPESPPEAALPVLAELRGPRYILTVF